MNHRFLPCFVLPLLAACGTDSPEPATTAPVAAEAAAYDPARDYFTFANTDQFVTTHLALDLDVDFDREQLRGTATLHMQQLDDSATTIVLDTRDITVGGVQVSRPGREALASDFSIAEAHPVMGSALSISLPDELAAGSELLVTISYHTSPGASALQWLPPELTSGGEHPFLFSQSQAIHARSWVPLQDTPSVRIAYEAVIRTPPELLAVMSANNDPDAVRDGEYAFEMPQPIPVYLLAIAVGDIYFAPIGTDTGVYAEQDILEAAAFEFADTQAMLEKAEDMFGPYQWGRYDLLILPPSFPYGGMENPRLSFLTPSLLAGDRSLVDVVAHELAHSWSGNLVTNATWRDGWLNEGMTSYLESRLMEVIYSEERADVDRVIGYRELLLNFGDVSPERQALAPPFPDGDPDDFQGTVHYHKGQLFLEYLEHAFGRDAFDAFLESYFAKYSFATITSEAFLDYIDSQLLSVEGSPVSRADAEQWLYQSGLPDEAVIPESAALDDAEAMAAQWVKGELTLADIPASGWGPKTLVHFINSLPGDLTTEQLAALDSTLGLSDTTNAEIGRTWFIQVAQRRYTPAYEELENHLNRYGRMRLVSPVYRALAENGVDAELARDMFERARDKYHPITIASVESALDTE